MKTWNQTISLLRNDEQKIVANGYPDLRVDRVLDGSIEGFDVQMLLDPLEEQLDLPALAVQFRDGQRVFNRKVIEVLIEKLSEKFSPDSSDSLSELIIGFLLLHRDIK